MARSVSCQESLDPNDWQNNSHPKHAAACDWRRYHFSSIKVIKLVLEAGCFSERGYILGSPPGGNTTSSDSQPLNSNLSEEETYFKTLFMHGERNTPGRKEGKKKDDRANIPKTINDKKPKKAQHALSHPSLSLAVLRVKAQQNCRYLF